MPRGGKTVTMHLARGALGFGILAGAPAMAASHPWILVFALPVALVALRGCPMCWTLGLVRTVAAKLRGRSADGLCFDGSCAIRRGSGRPEP